MVVSAPIDIPSPVCDFLGPSVTQPHLVRNPWHDFLGSVPNADLVPASVIVVSPVRGSLFRANGHNSIATNVGKPEAVTCKACPVHDAQPGEIVEHSSTASGSAEPSIGSSATMEPSDAYPSSGGTDLGIDASNAKLMSLALGGGVGLEELMDFNPQEAFEEIKRSEGGWAGLQARVAEMQDQAIRDGFGPEKWEEVRQQYHLPQEDVPWWWFVPNLRKELLEYIAQGDNAAKDVDASTHTATTAPSESTPPEPPHSAVHEGQEMPIVDVTQAGFHLDFAHLKAFRGLVMLLGGTCSKLFGLALMGYLAFQAWQANAARASMQQQQQQQPWRRPPQPQPQLVPQSVYRATRKS